MDVEDPIRPSEKIDIPNSNDVSILIGTDESMETMLKDKVKICAQACKSRKSDRVSPKRRGQ